MIIGRLFFGKNRFITIPIAVLLGLFFFPITILLIISWFIYTKVSNKKIKIVSLTIVGFFILFLGATYISAIVNPSPPKGTKQTEETLGAEKEENIEKQPESTPTTGNQKGATLIPTAVDIEQIEVKVSRVIDGDTIEIEGGQRIRYIGIDTPESGGCFAIESTNKNKGLVEGKMIRIERDVSETDRYGRLLRYVYVGNIFVNEALLKDGYAQVYTYPPDVKYDERFLIAQKEARENNRGLWSSCSEVVLSPKPTTASQVPATGSCKYSCSSPDRDCSDFSTHAEAQAFFNCCSFTATYDPMKLDSLGVGDGIACESLP